VSRIWNKIAAFNNQMAGITSLLRKTLKRGTNVVRRVGKVTRSTVKKGTNTIGLTKKSRSRKHRSRKH
jgi:hypothetical protein